MTRIGLTERVRIAAVRAQGLHRQAASRLLSSRILRWRHGVGGFQSLVILPQELRSRDPSFWAEVESGHFGLAGITVETAGRSPFDIEHQHLAWQRSLHGFGWLRHLEGAHAPDAEKAARGYVLDWLAKGKGRGALANDPAVRARRIISWIAAAHFLLDGANATEFDAIGRGISREVLLLTGTWRNAGHGYPRLLALTALVVAHLAIEGREKQLDAAERLLCAEIDRQILKDGGHVSRSPAALTDLLLDWLPLKSCFDDRKRTPPPSLKRAIAGMLIMIRYLKLGDGATARFNGTGIGDPAGLATLAAYDDTPLPEWGIAPASRYGRIERGDVILIADVGPAPPLPMSGQAHAGCLSFEMSAGHELVFVNAGAPGPAYSDWRAVSRATASHSTLCLGETSSSRLVRHAGLEAILGAVPLQLPAVVPARIEEIDGTLSLNASHDVYLARFGLVHTRELRLAADGLVLEGEDRLSTRGEDRLRRDVPFAIHFHLHPDCTCRRLYGASDGQEIAVIRLRNGQQWRFRATGAAMTIEESLFFKSSSGPRPSVQIVLRGASAGVTVVRWQALRDDETTAHSAGNERDMQ